jgi:signal peptidase I
VSVVPGRAAGRGRGWLLTLPLAVLVLAVVLPITVFAVGTWLAGYQLQPVLSASMSPTYRVGSLLVVAPVDASAVEPGMAVTFDDPAEPGRLVSHRVVARTDGPAGPAFITQGDASITRDPFPVPARSIRGRVMWNVPALGYAVDALRWPRGFVLLVVLPGVALAAGEVWGRRGRRDAGTSLVRPGIEPAADTRPTGFEAGR